MPQMMPMIWLIMMIFFIYCMLMFTSFLYFFSIPKISSKLFKSYSSYNWNWTW